MVPDITTTKKPPKTRTPPTDAGALHDGTGRDQRAEATSAIPLASAPQDTVVVAAAGASGLGELLTPIKVGLEAVADTLDGVAASLADESAA
ncbi:MAG: hypothetical protein WKF60_03755 [Ilumatobacter sp.]